MKSRFTIWLLGALVALAAGCTSFEKRWQAAATGPADGITGRWTGTWQNTNNDHGGALRALVTRLSETNYAARFHATWGEYSGSFQTELHGRMDGGEFVFTGRKRVLGFLVRTAGRADATNFFSTYESRFDNGTFTLHRP